MAHSTCIYTGSHQHAAQPASLFTLTDLAAQVRQLGCLDSSVAISDGRCTFSQEQQIGGRVLQSLYHVKYLKPVCQQQQFNLLYLFIQ